MSTMLTMFSNLLFIHKTDKPDALYQDVVDLAM